MNRAIGNPIEKIIIADRVAAARQPHKAMTQPTKGTSGPEIHGPIRKMPKAKLLRSRKTFAISTLIGML